MLREIRVSYLTSCLLTVLGWTILSGCASESGLQKKTFSKAERARMLVEIANGALLEGDPTGALQNLAHAEQLDSTLPELHHSKAVAYFTKRNLNLAIE